MLRRKGRSTRRSGGGNRGREKLLRLPELRPRRNPVPESAIRVQESASSGPTQTSPSPPSPDPGPLRPGCASGTEPGSAPAEVEPAGVLEEDVRDEQIEVTPGPVASHSPEPRPRRAATARQQSVHQAPEPDSKDFMKDRREASKRSGRPTRRSARPTARRPREVRKGQATERRPERGHGPRSAGWPRPRPARSLRLGHRTRRSVRLPASPPRPLEAKAEEIAPVRPDVDLLPITPPGVKPVYRPGAPASGLIGGGDLGGTRSRPPSSMPTTTRGVPDRAAPPTGAGDGPAALDAGTEGPSAARRGWDRSGNLSGVGLHLPQ